MMEIIDCAQNSPEWLQARLGIVTASRMGTVMASGRSGAESKTRRSYMLQLAGEIITGEPAETFSNTHMERGHVMEPEARDNYAFMHDVEPQLVGFIRNGDKGASPDSLVGNNGLLEIKTKLPALLIDCLLRKPDDFPPEHKAQCQGALWVAEREWIDLAIYYPKMPLVVFRAHRDAKFIADLASAVRQFNEELHETVERVRAYGTLPERAAA